MKKILLYLPVFIYFGVLAYAVTTTYRNDYFSPKDDGAKGNDSQDDAPYIQSCINRAKGRPIHLASGTYRCYSQIVYNTSGTGVAEGLKIWGDGSHTTVLKNMINAPLFLVTAGTQAADFQENVFLSDFAITSTNTVSGGMGIQLHAVRRSVLQNLYILNESSHAIHLASTGTDKDNANIVIDNCDLEGSGGAGIYLDGGSANVNAAVNIKNCRLIGNLFGIVAIGQSNLWVSECAVAYNTSTGVFVTNGLTANGNFSKEININDNEFDTNGFVQVAISGGESVSLNNNYFIANSGLSTTFNVGVSLQNSFNVQISQSLPRIGVGLSGITMYRILSNASYTTINDTDWTAWIDTGNSKFSDSGIQTIINDSGQALKPPRQNTFTSSDNAPAVWIIPNSTSTFQRVIIGTTTNVTISTPVYAEGGSWFELLIWNTSGGNATAQFVPIYSTSTWTNPIANGAVRTGKFTYDSGSVKWRQIGAWSGDEK